MMISLQEKERKAGSVRTISETMIQYHLRSSFALSFLFPSHCSWTSL